jgi:hypothetical protein
MFHNHWDLEVISRDMQERRWREAEAARRVEMLGSRSGERRSRRLIEDVARALMTLRGLVSLRALDHAARPESRPLVAQAAALATGEPGGRLVGTRPQRQVDPFAAMAIIANGSATAPVQQPCNVADC